jgi:peptidoglycan hydrolase CwlO-like protein
MAAAEGLKATHGVDDKVQVVHDKVQRVDDKVQHVDNKVQDVDEHVQRVGDEVQGVDDHVRQIDNKVQDVDRHIQRIGDEVQGVDGHVRQIDDKMQGVDNKVQQIADDMGDQKRSSSDIITSLAMKAQKLTGDQIRKDLRNWLSPPDPSVNYNIASDAHHEGTAMWFMESDAFNNWKASDSLLWIYGKRTSPALCSFDLALINLHFYSWLWEECTQVRHFPPRFTRGY